MDLSASEENTFSIFPLSSPLQQSIGLRSNPSGAIACAGNYSIESDRTGYFVPNFDFTLELRVSLSAGVIWGVHSIASNNGDRL
ncbi:MAG: hypothetical protein ACFBSE_20020 [Prochloraceae cyanobacterium]